MVLLATHDYRSSVDPRLPARKTLDRSLTGKAWQQKVMAEARRLGWRLMVHVSPGSFRDGRWLTNVNKEGIGF